MRSGRRARWKVASVISAALSLLTGQNARGDEAAACDVSEVDYALSARVRITNTSMGMGDGTYPTGPGYLRLRFERRAGSSGEVVKLVQYRMRDHFTVSASMIIASASVTAETVSVTTPDACGVSASGLLVGHTLRWDGPWSGMRSDGKVTCDGSLCGRFGAPPKGDSPAHVPPHSASFAPFEYSDDGETFTMTYSVASSQASPSQTSHLALAGRALKRRCVAAPPCSTEGRTSSP